MDLIWWALGIAVVLVVLLKRQKQAEDAPQGEHPEIVGLSPRRARAAKNSASGAAISATPNSRSSSASQAGPPTQDKPASVPRPRVSPSRVKLFTYPMERTAFPPLAAPLDQGASPEGPPRAILKGVRWVSRGIVEVGEFTIVAPLVTSAPLRFRRTMR